MIPERSVELVTADNVTVEGRLAVPEGAAVGVAVCHPHPLYGGDMDNPVVVRAAESCAVAGLATLRFNFRGVGASGGMHDGGRGEQADVHAALDRLGEILGADTPLALAGYSFGASVVAAVAASRPTAGLALIAPPLGVAGYELPSGLEAVRGPILVVGGTRDDYCPREALERLARTLPGAAVRIVDGADHLFLGRLFPLGEAVAEWAGTLEAGQPRGGGGAG